ncbi:UDP-N-acetylglucosamine--N-acetylmuramyl-(pentapeptide) pyrophosphoryl-undecaprenol N-acetylglucosamine transferase [Candidatus Nomurabacteria bacterium]|nr:UDP-N-acetylglucosamine--N-acetylmuramyl-(pentapeptide) pyrophosphoryl-undecaprenol N-acetylglucosamine transferase [Candidatus Nomurabacteria bacterium]
MKILLAGGGTGGHFYPLIAIAEELNRIQEEEHLVNFKLYYMSDSPYDAKLLKAQFITYIPITAGKLRVYFSLKNIIDLFKTGIGVISALFKVFSLYPDVVISKGGYASFPTLCAAWFLRIPVIIHESDTVPGRVNKWAGKFARRIALSYPEAAEYFPKEKIAVTGQPIRHSIAFVAKEGGKDFFDFDPSLPVIGIVGGSLGAKIINDLIVEIIPQLVEKYQVIHQTGIKGFDEVKSDASVMLGEHLKRNRYRALPYLNDLQTKMFGSACDLIVSRAGSMLFEIAAWGKPSIVIPGKAEVYHADHQRKNAYHYARTGAAAVIEEKNLTPSILMNQIELILDNKERYDTMASHARQSYRPDAARIIATEAVKTALEHEK